QPNRRGKACRQVDQVCVCRATADRRLPRESHGRHAVELSPAGKLPAAERLKEAQKGCRCCRLCCLPVVRPSRHSSYVGVTFKTFFRQTTQTVRKSSMMQGQ